MRNLNITSLTQTLIRDQGHPLTRINQLAALLARLLRKQEVIT
jgi:hypothetical protein